MSDWFQFHEVQLKDVAVFLLTVFTVFQFHEVQLKVIKESKPQIEGQSFNSMKYN